jgi:hypothetical protein
MLVGLWINVLNWIGLFWVVLPSFFCLDKKDGGQSLQISLIQIKSVWSMSYRKPILLVNIIISIKIKNFLSILYLFCSFNMYFVSLFYSSKISRTNAILFFFCSLNILLHHSHPMTKHVIVFSFMHCKFSLLSKINCKSPSLYLGIICFCCECSTSHIWSLIFFDIMHFENRSLTFSSAWKHMQHIFDNCHPLFFF